MDMQKLKLEKFSEILIMNFPPQYEIPLESTQEKPEVIIYYIDKLKDVEDFISLCRKSGLPKENRTIWVYEKGRKDGVNRDSIYGFFQLEEQKDFTMKAPMLCSLSKKLSAFSMMLQV